MIQFGETSDRVHYVLNMDLNAFVMCSLNVIIVRTFESYFTPLVDMKFIMDVWFDMNWLCFVNNIIEFTFIIANDSNVKTSVYV